MHLLLIMKNHVWGQVPVLLCSIRIKTSPPTSSIHLDSPTHLSPPKSKKHQRGPMLDPKFWKPAKMAKTVALLGRGCVCLCVCGCFW